MRDCTVMEWNAKTSSLWDWESLDLFNGKVSDTSTRMQPMDWGIEGDGGIDNGSVYSSRGGGGSGSGSDLGNGSSSKSSISVAVESSSKAQIGVSEFYIKTDKGSPKDHLKRKELGAEDAETCSELVTSAGAGEPMIGLKLGKRTYFEDVCAGSTMKSSSLSVASSSSANSIKKSRALYQNMQTPRCQVEGCNLDLTAAKHYHQKHRVCESHSKSPRVVIAGQERRFCQQCSRFHELAEFDEKKRSCRRRLSEHNARRRKPQTDTISYNSTRLPSSFYGGKQQMNIMLNSLPVIHARPAVNVLWEGSSELKLAQAKGSWLRTTKTGGIDGQLHVPSDGLPTAIPTVCHDHVKQLPFKRTTAAVLNQGLEASMIDSSLNPSPDFQRALSLLSTNSWVSTRPEPSSLNQFMHSGHTNMSQPAIQTVHQVLPFASLEHWQAELPLAEARVPPLALQSSGSQFQEFQLFKAPYASGFFDNSRMC